MVNYNLYVNDYFGIVSNLIHDNWVIGLIFTIAMCVANWKILVKANEAGWKQFIPIYSSYIEFKLYWSGVAFWFVFTSPLLIGLAALIIALINNALVTTMLALFISFVLAFLLVFSVIIQFKKAKCFSQSMWFGIGLIILNPVFKLILAFDKNCVYNKK